MAQVDLIIPKVSGAGRGHVFLKLFSWQIFLEQHMEETRSTQRPRPLKRNPEWVAPGSNSSLLPVWLFGEQFLGNGWLSRWSERKSEKFHVLHLPVCVMPAILSPQPAQSLQFPQTDAIEQHPPHSPGSPVFPAGQLSSP